MSQVNKIIVTRSFENAVKALKKKHKSNTLNELYDVVDKLSKYEITSQKSNHPLKDMEGHKDIHLEGGNLILLYKYEDDVLTIALKLQDLVNHTSLKNYTKKKLNAPTKEFDPETIKSSKVVYSNEDFSTWYNGLLEEDQWLVDDIADSENIPFYENADIEDLNWLCAQFESKYGDICCDENIDQSEDDIEDLTLVDQEYDSAKTSINSKNLPAVYNMISLPAGSVGVDFGGGKFDNAVEYLADKDVTLYVYDPYNRSAEHNREVLKALRANGGADFAINSNVLNVIKEPEARRNVLENIKKITKPGAPIYITVYEGSGKGNEGATKSGYQLNRKTADYLEEIQEVFPDASRKGKLIKAINSSTDIMSAIIDDRYVTVDEVIEHVSTLVFGAADRYFHDIGYDIDYAYYDITQEDHSRIKIEIRTEMEYVELEALSEALNPVVWDLDNDSYFEPVTYGIIEAYVSIRKVAQVMGYKYTPSSTLDASAKIESAWDDIPEPNLDPPEYDEGNEVETEADCDFEAINIKVTVDEDGSWEYETIEFLNPYRGKVWTSDEYDVEIGDASDIIEDFDELVEPYIPGAAGIYYMNGKGDLMYNISGIRVVTTNGWFDERSGWEYDEEVYKDDVDIDFDRDKSSIDVIFTESPIIK